MSTTAKMEVSAQRKNTMCIRFSRKFFIIFLLYRHRANRFALFYQSVNSLTRGRPVGDVADIDTLDLIHRQVVNGVRRVYDYCDAVKCDGGAGKLCSLVVLHLAGCHADGKGAVHRAGHAGRWESEVCRSMLAFGFTALYASISFSITGGYRGGTADCDLSGRTVGSKGCCIVVNSDVLVISYNSLTFLGEDEVDKILGYAGRLALGCNIERTGQLVGACLYVIYGSFCAVYLDSLYGVIQRTEGNVADSPSRCLLRWSVNIGLVGDLGIRGGIVDLLACVVLLLYTSQFDERAARTGTILT